MDYLVDKAQDSLVQLLVVVFSIAIVITCTILRSKLLRWLKRHFVVEALRDDHKIMELLVEIRVKTVADRVSIFLFHNGERYVNGNSILRLSGSYESLAAGISSHREYSQNILVSTVPQAVVFLCGDDPTQVVAYQRTQELESCFYKAVLESQGIQSVAKYPLRKGGDIIGFICADFVQSSGPTVGELRIIKEMAPQIELRLHSRGSRLQRFLYKLSHVFGGGS
jgi:hypothetical protein